MTTTKEALDAIEEANEVIEQTLDILENSPTMTPGKLRLLKFGSLTLVVGGVALVGYASYKLGVKRTTAKYELVLEEEIAAAKEFYKRQSKADEFETPEKAVEALVPDQVVEAINSYQGKDKTTPYNKVPPQVEEPVETVVQVQETVEVRRNVFATTKVEESDEWDYETELAKRDPTRPYVISLDEFTENSEGHEQSTLSYFVEDDTLVDERDSPIDNTDYTVGDDNLLRFGDGSNDSKIVYVRNERISMDFEIIRSEGSFAKEVLGFDDSKSLRHSHRRQNRRSWRADE